MPIMNTEPPPNVSQHDHQGCIASAMAKAEQISKQRILRFTPLRRRVLELVWQSHRPIGAYELLGELKAEEGCPAPPTIYRALDFLLEQGFIHRINALNAFVGCPHAEHQHQGQMFICEICQNVTEVTDLQIESAVKAAAGAEGFSVNRQWLEVVGVCQNCAPR